MHKKSQTIIQNLGFGKEVLETLKKQPADTPLSRRTITKLKEFGLPKAAIDQIKFLEAEAPLVEEGASNKEMLETLIKKCRRSFDAFANKQVPARIIFSDGTWTMYSEEYNRTIEKLHKVCKIYFDIWADHGLDATLIFDGSSTWKVSTDKESDLPDIGG